MGRIAKVVGEMGLTSHVRLVFSAVMWTPEAIPDPKDGASRFKAMRWREFRQLVHTAILKSMTAGRRRGWRRDGFYRFSVLARSSKRTSISGSVSFMRTVAVPDVMRIEFDRLADEVEAKFRQAESESPRAKRVVLWLALTDTPDLLGAELKKVLMGSDGHPWPPKCRNDVDEMYVVGLDTLHPGIDWFWPREAGHTEPFFDITAWSDRSRARLRSLLHNYFAIEWRRFL